VAGFNRDGADLAKDRRAFIGDRGASTGRDNPSSRRTADPEAGGYVPPSPLEWMIAVFAVVIQQAAFVWVPLLLAGGPISDVGEVPNPYNTVTISLSGLAVGILCFIHYRKIVPLIWQNPASILLVIIIIASSLWSIHPELTFRRSNNYIVTMLTAVYLSGRFATGEAIKVLSWGLALSAIGSFLFVVVYPGYGIMQDTPDLAGNWRGVFIHKNQLGWVMAVGVFVECYILASAPPHRGRHLALLIAFFVLVAFSRSTTALLSSVFYLSGAGIYLLWARARAIAPIISVALALLGLTTLVAFWDDPGAALAWLGKDATLTGRAELWAEVPNLIAERPLLGWGYEATWQPNDNATIYIWNILGWDPPSAHNALLEVTLQLGLTGLVVVLAVIAVALWRSIGCFSAGLHHLGAFSLLFFLVTIYSGVTEAVLAQNQSIPWVAFNILSLSCGLEVAQVKAHHKQKQERIGTTILSRTEPLGETGIAPKR